MGSVLESCVSCAGMGTLVAWVGYEHKHSRVVVTTVHLELEEQSLPKLA